MINTKAGCSLTKHMTDVLTHSMRVRQSATETDVVKQVNICGNHMCFPV